MRRNLEGFNNSSCETLTGLDVLSSVTRRDEPVIGTHQRFAHAATTRGLYFTWLTGNTFSQRRQRVVADTLMIGLGTRRFSDWSRFTAAAPFAESNQPPVFYSNTRGFR